MEPQNKFEQFFALLHEAEHLRARGVADLRDEVAGSSPDNIIPKCLDTLHVNSDALATTFARVWDIPIYPFSDRPSALSDNAPRPHPPQVVDQGQDWIYCSNGVAYMVNPLSSNATRQVTGRCRGQGLSSLGVISKRAYMIAAGQHFPGDADSSGASDMAAAGPDANSAIRRKVESLLLKASRADASDIYLEPQKNDARIRFRIDSIVREVDRCGLDEFKAMVNIILERTTNGTAGSYAEVLHSMFMFQVPPARWIKFRVMMIPVVVPSSQVELPMMCLRLLGNTLEPRGLRELGIPNTQHNDQLTRLRLLCERRFGLILVTGPTGSGKTTTLTAVLSEMQRTYPDRCRYTAEDPVEMSLAGVNHVQINEATQLDFEEALKAFLRGAPDEILVGEVRDFATAAKCLTAALTGHLVFSTIHTNSAVESISRLIDLGCDHYIVASALKAATAQRLVRKVCMFCSTTAPWGELVSGTHPSLADPENSLMALRYRTAGEVYRDLKDFPDDDKVEVRLAGPGCPKCDNTGYKGRVLVTELLEISLKISDMISKRASGYEILRQARREGFREMWEHAATLLFKAKVTTLDELINSLGERELLPNEDD